MATNRTYEVVLRAILLACLAGIIVLILGPVFVQAKVPLAVVISSGVTGGWIALVEPRLRARAAGDRSRVRGMAEGLTLGVVAALLVSIVP